MIDHGYQTDDTRRCTAMTKKERRCSLPPLMGINLCALHSGLAKARTDPRYGDPVSLEAYRRSLGAAATQTRRAPVR